MFLVEVRRVNPKDSRVRLSHDVFVPLHCMPETLTLPLSTGIPGLRTPHSCAGLMHGFRPIPSAWSVSASFTLSIALVRNSNHFRNMRMRHCQELGA